MAGYKLGQKVLLSDGSQVAIENIQLGDQVLSFDIPEIVVGVDFTELQSLTLNIDDVQTPEVIDIYQHQGNYLQIHELGVIDAHQLG